MEVVRLVYIAAACALAVYGFNTLVYVFLYWRHRRDVLPARAPASLPTVTVQLPIYNEMYVVQRLIDAAAALDYPRDRLQIQVLDDSTDMTTALAQERVEYYRKRGLEIELVRRGQRTGFKAGALRESMKTARGEFIAIFDADFVPPADFLKRTLPYFGADSKIGLIQTRWAHLNAAYSALTRAQAIALDGYFVVEQTARARGNLFMNFNGSAGIWRRACIEDAGGWQEDTLSEDLDLSYRAQLKGWRLTFLPDVGAPAEIPPQIHAFKRQQFRWAKGSTQVIMKLLPQVLHSSASPFKKFEGLIHLTGYFVHPWLILLLLTMVPLMLAHMTMPAIMALFGLATFAPPLVYTLSQRELYPDWAKRLRYLGVLMLIGTGMAFNSTMAIGQAFLRRENTFRRTPKFAVGDDGESWAEKHYVLGFEWQTLGEIFLTLYPVWGITVALQTHNEWAVPFLALYALAFGYTAGLTLWHSRPRRAELAAA